MVERKIVPVMELRKKNNWKSYPLLRGINKNLGQCFIINQVIIEDIIKKINPQGNILEIGGGTGILSWVILNHLNGTGFLTIIEIDPYWHKHLINLLSQLPYDNYEIILGDGLLYIPSNPVSLIGNIPYNISTQLINNILKNSHLYLNWGIMVQKEFADSLLDKNNFLGKVFEIFKIKVQIIKKLSGQSFYPAPKVKSVFILCDFQDIVDIVPDIVKLLKILYCNRNKRIKNILSISSHLIEEKINLLRPRELTISQAQNIIKLL